MLMQFCACRRMVRSPHIVLASFFDAAGEARQLTLQSFSVNRLLGGLSACDVFSRFVESCHSIVDECEPQ